MAKSNSFFNIDMLVLSLLKVKDCYGYELVKLIKEISNGSLDIKEGTLYPVVHNLLKKEYISSRDEIVNKKIRVYYHIEPIGKEYLEERICKVYLKSLHMVKAKKMSNDIKKYIKYVKKIISIHSKDKKEFIQLLTQKIIEFSNEHDSCSYQDIVDEFGSPNEVAGSYIETLNSDEIIKKLNKKKIINIFISVIIILCISVWGFERYRINQLIDEAKHTKMKTYTAEEYKEKIAKEKQEK